jgi:prepilin-type N-terminal cleavage/methylation domain-containing protein
MRMLMNKRALNGRGFSLTELLVVIAVILILAALIFVGANQVYSMAMQTKCQHRLEQIGHALQMYANKNQGMLPAARAIGTGQLWYEALAGTYVDNLSILGCPSVGTPPEILERQGYQPPESEELIDQARKVLFWMKKNQQSGGDHDGRIAAIVRSDGRVGFYNRPVTVNALCVMAFLGFGYTDRYPEEFADTIRRAILYVIRHQKSNGLYRDWYRWGGQIGEENTLAVHSICLMGMAAAYKAVEDPELRSQIRSSVQSGINWLANNTHPDGGYSGTVSFYYDEEGNKTPPTKVALSIYRT